MSASSRAERPRGDPNSSPDAFLSGIAADLAEPLSALDEVWRRYPRVADGGWYLLGPNRQKSAFDYPQPTLIFAGTGLIFTGVATRRLRRGINGLGSCPLNSADKTIEELIS